jgi:hypothetical protein
MGLEYIDKKNKLNWADITREERFFTCYLYNDFIKSYQRAVDFIKSNIKLVNNRKIASVFKQSDDIEIAYEVCIYRDLRMIRPLPECKTAKYSNKRTFDLCIFSSSGLLVIEAKAQQGYTGAQLADIKNDRELLKTALGIDESSVKIISIHSNLYHPTPATLGHFDGYITWDMVSKEYQENESIYLRANSIYRK